MEIKPPENFIDDCVLYKDVTSKLSRKKNMA